MSRIVGSVIVTLIVVFMFLVLITVCTEFLQKHPELSKMPAFWGFICIFLLIAAPLAVCGILIIRKGYFSLEESRRDRALIELGIFFAATGGAIAVLNQTQTQHSRRRLFA